MKRSFPLYLFLFLFPFCLFLSCTRPRPYNPYLPPDLYNPKYNCLRFECPYCYKSRNLTVEQFNEMAFQQGYGDISFLNLKKELFSEKILFHCPYCGQPFLISFQRISIGVWANKYNSEKRINWEADHTSDYRSYRWVGNPDYELYSLPFLPYASFQEYEYYKVHKGELQNENQPWVCPAYDFKKNERMSVYDPTSEEYIRPFSR